MSEKGPNNPERDDISLLEKALDQVIADYLEADKDFLSGYDFEDKLGEVYGLLLELGLDPDVILSESGVFDEEVGSDEV